MKRNVIWMVAGALVAAIVLFNILSLPRHRAGARHDGPRFSEREIVEKSRGISRLLMPNAGAIDLRADYSDSGVSAPGRIGMLKLWNVACTTDEESRHAVIIYDAETGNIRLVSVFGGSDGTAQKDFALLRPEERIRFARQWMEDCSGRTDAAAWQLTSARAALKHTFEYSWLKGDQIIRVVIDGYTGQLIHYYIGAPTSLPSAEWSFPVQS